MKLYRNTRQKKYLLELLKSTRSHPTAAWLFERLKPRFPNLSMGTVYRNLKILQQQYLIQKLDFGSTFDRYDANLSVHYHFVCDQCGCIEDLPGDVNQNINHIVAHHTDYVIRAHRLEFFGLCQACQKQPRKGPQTFTAGEPRKVPVNRDKKPCISAKRRKKQGDKNGNH